MRSRLEELATENSQLHRTVEVSDKTFACLSLSVSLSLSLSLSFISSLLSRRRQTKLSMPGLPFMSVCTSLSHRRHCSLTSPLPSPSPGKIFESGEILSAVSTGASDEGRVHQQADGAHHSGLPPLLSPLLSSVMTHTCPLSILRSRR
jgi:hypothetical protein